MPDESELRTLPIVSHAVSSRQYTPKLFKLTVKVVRARYSDQVNVRILADRLADPLHCACGQKLRPHTPLARARCPAQARVFKRANTCCPTHAHRHRHRSIAAHSRDASLYQSTCLPTHLPSIHLPTVFYVHFRLFSVRLEARVSAAVAACKYLLAAVVLHSRSPIECMHRLVHRLYPRECVRAS